MKFFYFCIQEKRNEKEKCKREKGKKKDKERKLNT